MRASGLRASLAVVAAMVAVGAGMLVGGSPRAAADDGLMEAPQARGRGAAQPPAGVFKSRVDAHWFANNTRFWYRNDGAAGAREFMVVVIEGDSAKRQAAFDHAKLAAGLSRATTQNYSGDKLPFDVIEFTGDNKAVKFTVTGTSPAAGTTWSCDLGSYECTKSEDAVGMLPVMPWVGEESEETVWAAPQILTQTQPTTTQGAGGRAGRFGGRGGGSAGAGGAVRGGRGARGAGSQPAPLASPDGKWSVILRDNNLVLRSAAGEETALSTDGTAAFPYVMRVSSWSPDSSTFVTFRMEPGDNFAVHKIISSPSAPEGTIGEGGAGRAFLMDPEQVYPLAGDKFDSYELNLFDIATKKQIKPQVDRQDMQEAGTSPLPVWEGGGGGDGGYLNSPVRYQWMKDGAHFRYEKVDRGHLRLRYMEVNAKTGEARTLIDDQADGKVQKFIWTANRDGIGGLQLINTLQSEDELIHVSERDGWRHIYLIDAKSGKIKNPITKGEWVLRGMPARGNNMPAIDQANRVVYFAASGMYPDQDPYSVHYGHVKFDGTGLVWMTAGDGNHSISYSPDYSYIVDSYNRVDFAGKTELRRVSDGKLMCALETTELTVPWNKPEVVVSKARDGKTDIWGVVYKPTNLDPTKKYPVIENIYAGPHTASAPHSFSLEPRPGDVALLNMGFVIVKVDGLGTAQRSKAFHDVCWQNIGDAGFPDRILWMKEAASKRPYMDLDRVGIFGTSAGGQNAAAAVLFHPEFYKVAVANCGCHDNRMDKATWNEQWMGYPVGPQYSASSNIDNASRLQGHLQLVVGELDTNVPPESTYRLVDALIKARRDFEFVLVPGTDHGASAPNPYGSATQTNYAQRKLQDFFQRYLQGVEPANRNLTPASAPGPAPAPGARGRRGGGGGGGGGGGEG